MAPRGQEPLLREIQAACVNVAEYIAELDETAFDTLADTDHRTFRAIKNALTEIGEAIKSLPDELCARHGGIDWKGFAGLRDMVAHQYFRLDTQRLWPVLVEELPVLLEAVEEELGTGPGPRP